MSATEAVRVARQHLTECGFGFVRVLGVSPRNGKVEVQVDVGATMERLGTLVIDKVSRQVVSSSVRPLSRSRV